MSGNTPTHGSLVSMMDNLLKETADLEKQGAANLDLASDSKSTHPSASVDDKTKPATEGSRSAENDADVRKDVPDNVEDAASKNTPGDSKKPSDSMGTVSMDADSGLQGNVDTPKKDHSQSMTDSGPGDGSESFKGDWDKASAAELLTEANGILEEISKVAGEDDDAAAPSADDGEAAPAADAGAAPADAGAADAGAADAGAADDSDKTASDEELIAMYKEAAEKYPDAEEAGYVAASLLAQYLAGEHKDAADQDPYGQVVSDLTKEAQADAESYVGFLQGYQDSMQKAAMMGMDAGMAGAPAEAAAAGPEAAMGAEGGEGGEGGELDDESVVEALAEALDEAGVTPEELAEAVAEAQGGAPAEGAAEGGEMPPEALAALAGGGGGGLEAAAAAKGQKPMAKAADKKSAERKALLKSAVEKLVRGK